MPLFAHLSIRGQTKGSQNLTWLLLSRKHKIVVFSQACRVNDSAILYFGKRCFRPCAPAGRGKCKSYLDQNENNKKQIERRCWRQLCLPQNYWGCHRAVFLNTFYGEGSRTQKRDRRFPHTGQQITVPSRKHPCDLQHQLTRKTIVPPSCNQ
jgi:hypothetical protein